MYSGGVFSFVKMIKLHGFIGDQFKANRVFLVEDIPLCFDNSIKI